MKRCFPFAETDCVCADFHGIVVGIFIKISSLNSKLFIGFILIIISLTAFGQEKTNKVLAGKVIEGDTTALVELPEIEIFSFHPTTRREQRRLTRLMINVKKVYPYAKLAGIKLKEYDEILSKAKNDRERKQIMKKLEKEINDQYGPELKNLTFSQGKILIKLIDRETGDTSYDLVSELRGNFVAFFYQTFARVFGYNLKVRYDPNGEDKDIEHIVRMIENGQL